MQAPIQRPEEFVLYPGVNVVFLDTQPPFGDDQHIVIAQKVIGYTELGASVTIDERATGITAVENDHYHVLDLGTDQLGKPGEVMLFFGGQV